MSSYLVSIKRLDDIIGDTPVDLLKIDVEGSDTWVLMGAKDSLCAKRVKRIWFEQNKVRMKKLGIDERAAQSFLRSVGYSARPMSDASQSTVDWLAVPA